MTALDTAQWRELNDRYITASVAWVRALLAERIPPAPPVQKPPLARKPGFFARLFGANSPDQPVDLAPSEPAVASELSSIDAAAKRKEVASQLEAAGVSSTAQQIADRFGLTPFEQNILLLCLAFELDTRVGWLCGLIQDRPYRPFPTFGLAMSLFAEPEWLAFPPERSLRKFRLIECRQPAGTPLFGADLRLEETILHYLRGVASLDARLATFAAPVADRDLTLSESQERALGQFRAAGARADGPPLVFQMTGGSADIALPIAQAAARQMGWKLLQTSLDFFQAGAADIEDLAALWQRDSALFRLGLLIDAQDAAAPENAVKMARIARFAAEVSTPIFVMAPERVPLAGVRDIDIEVRAPSAHEQLAAWLQLLPERLADRHELAGELSRQFSMNPGSMRDAVLSVGSGQEHESAAAFRAAVWQTCRVRSRPRVDGLAQRIDAKATWSDLVLADDRVQLLEQIRNQVRGRWRVYDDWGLADTMNRGLGISALFTGGPGTGKTMAAEVIANDLQLDLFRVDLSSVADKYIGVAEKRLRRLFDAFEECGAILFFDECDALFAKRTEVKDSHARYANFGTSYLLQRLESYRGLCILATNNRGALDSAFFRRFRFLITFSMPTLIERKQMWQKMLPVENADVPGKRIPTKALDYDRLAQLPLSGGNIHSVIVNAAFRAANRTENIHVTMRDVLSAARDEFVKLERPISESEFAYAEIAAQEAAA